MAVCVFDEFGGGGGVWGGGENRILIGCCELCSYCSEADVESVLISFCALTGHGRVSLT
jgi:hypothetical protein